MSATQIDAFYDAFVDSLPTRLGNVARHLPFTLRLAPSPGARFSEVFSHEVTLAAPLLVAEALPGITPELVRSSVVAHMLAVVEAFGRDRVADGQVAETPQLLEIFDRLRDVRCRELDRLWPGAGHESVQADEVAGDAIAHERELLREVVPVSYELYSEVSLGKQAVGYPASLALARAAGAGKQKLMQIDRMLTGVWLGLQFEDDVVDWEDDWRNGGAWAVNIARWLRSRAPRVERPTEPDLVRRAVLGTDVLQGLLVRARRKYRTAWRHARCLGASRLADWAQERDARLRILVHCEAKHAGYMVRARRLAPWVAEVLT